MESPNTPMRSGPCISRADSGVTAGTDTGVATGPATGVTGLGAGAGALGGAEALARSPSITVGWRSQSRPSGVSSSPANTPTTKVAVSALTPARNFVPRR